MKVTSIILCFMAVNVLVLLADTAADTDTAINKPGYICDNVYFEDIPVGDIKCRPMATDRDTSPTRNEPAPQTAHTSYSAIFLVICAVVLFIYAPESMVLVPFFILFYSK